MSFGRGPSAQEVLAELVRKQDIYRPDMSKCTVPQALRGRLVAWMVQVGHELDLDLHTVSAAINFFDRVLCSIQAPAKAAQVLAVSCLFTSSKMSECAGPSSDEFLAWAGTDPAFDRRMLVELEKFVLSKLRWQMNPCTPIQVARLCASRLERSCSSFVMKRVQFMLEEAHEIPELADVPASHLGAAAFLAVMESFSMLTAQQKRDLHAMLAEAGIKLSALKDLVLDLTGRFCGKYTLNRKRKRMEKPTVSKSTRDLDLTSPVSIRS
mmetsp:Transcript_15326/g.32954  ORF Transcript_15326/g.32954 Transcript_15326/m.32954 type:complete len:267 (+) Transcript_15326:358-1158(+)